MDDADAREDGCSLDSSISAHLNCRVFRRGQDKLTLVSPYSHDYRKYGASCYLLPIILSLEGAFFYGHVETKDHGQSVPGPQRFAIPSLKMIHAVNIFLADTHIIQIDRYRRLCELSTRRFHLIP